MIPLYQILDDIVLERGRQDAKWGQQNHPDGTDDSDFGQHRAESAKAATEDAVYFNRLTWMHILDEEVQEAFAETSPRMLRAELLQVAAVAVAWIEGIDRRPDA